MDGWASRQFLSMPQEALASFGVRSGIKICCRQRPPEHPGHAAPADRGVLLNSTCRAADSESGR